MIFLEFPGSKCESGRVSFFAGGAHRAEDLPAGRARHVGLRRADGRRAHPDQQGPRGVPEPQADRRGPRHPRVHHPIRRR